MLQILILIVAIIAVGLAFKSFTTGIDLGVGGIRLQGTAGIFTGVVLLLIAAGLVFFALVGMSLLFGD